MELRPITRDDVVFVNKTRNHYSVRSMLNTPDAYTIEETYEWYDRTSPKWYIVENDKESVGYLRTSNDTGLSIWVGVDIAVGHRRKGYARWAYNNFLTEIKRNGYEYAELEVLTQNTAAINLYNSLGFGLVEVITNRGRSKQFFHMILNLEEFNKQP